MMKYATIMCMELCDEIDYLKYELKLAREEAAEYRAKYNDMLDSSIRHSDVMMVNMLNVLFTPGVTELLVNDDAVVDISLR